MPASRASCCAVWSREVSFAKAACDRDVAVFAEHILEGAVFVGSEGTLRGRQAIVKGWDRVLRGENLRVEWHPTEVIVTSDPHVAMSRGPMWTEVTAPGA